MRYYRSTMLSDDDYRRLFAFRSSLRRFLHWSEQEAQAHGVTAAQHQLLLAIAGSGDQQGPTIGDIAEALLLKHHSAVGLIDRAEAGGLVRRTADPRDHRVVRLALTARGRKRLEVLSRAHLEELHRIAPALEALLRSVETTVRA
jgi:DNA-binding MarR family transcriptional regulator